MHHDDPHTAPIQSTHWVDMPAHRQALRGRTRTRITTSYQNPITMIRNLTPLLFLATAGLCAQPTIQQVSLNAGDVFVFDPNFPMSESGPGGAGAVWNFSGSAFSGNTMQHTARNAVSMPDAALFPDATMVLESEPGSAFETHTYIDLNGGYTEHGHVFIDNPFAQQNVFSDPMMIFSTPLTASSAGVDSYSSVSITSYGEVHTTGTNTWTVDGYGTLVMPNATYTDVMRVRGVHVEVNTLNINGIIVNTDYLLEEWRWVKAGIPAPLLVFSMETDVDGTRVAGRVGLISFNGATGIGNSAELPMRVYPNPVRDIVTIELEAQGSVQYRVLDALGREVLQGSISVAGTLRHNINVSALNTGLYQLEVRSAEGMATQGLIIE